MNERTQDKPTAAKRRRTQSGFTLIELLVVVTIIGILAAIAVVSVKHAQQKARETALRADLYEMRKAIDDYYADKQHYPPSLEDLKPRYLRKIPNDPITGAADWKEVQEDPNDPNNPSLPDASGGSGTVTQPGIVDVKTSAQGTTLDGINYEDL
jgi:general secretion pathway protein G